jgi:catechol 2,3-dioxygenase-like lactoylglutathione lyase family enzyme
MKPRINVLTLAVNDLERSLAFYRDGLGLPTKGVVGSEFLDSATGAAGAVAFFELDGGLMFALYPRSELAKDSHISADPPSSVEFSIGHIVESKDAVDQLLERARAAGGVVTGNPHDRPWGIYSGYFKDPDGHLWEIIWDSQGRDRDTPDL